MQIFGLHKSIYKLNKVVAPEESSLSSRITNIREQLKIWERLKTHKVPDHEIANITKMSRASFYRYKKAVRIYGFKGLEIRSKRPKTLRKSNIPEGTIDLILKLRKSSPTYGKTKITVLLKRDCGITLSESSVGRVLTKLMHQNKIQRSVSSIRVKRKRNFTKAHAKRWEYGMKASDPGEFVQIDHMTVSKHNISMKEFSAWDPITKVMVSDITSNATSKAASRFLKKVIKDMPFPIKSIQVDGGSEFMKYFEAECEKLNIQLFVLPPSRPQWNGGVERSNRIFREEFWGQDCSSSSIGEFKYELQQAVHKYNTYRPHYSLKGKTPYEYTREILEAA